MMEWYQMLSYLLTNGMRLIAGLYLVAKLTKFSPDKKTLLLSVLGGCLVTALQASALPAAGVLAAELFWIAALAWYHLRDKLNLCLFLIFFYEVGVGLWDFLISAGLGILFRSESFIHANAPEYLLGIWLVRLLMAVFIILWEKRQNGNPSEAVRFASIAAILGMFGAVTLSEQTRLPMDEDQMGTWIVLSMVLLFAILFYRLNRQREMEAEIARLKQNQVEILERDYGTLSKTYADNAKLYHDLHHHIEAIYQCLVQGDVQEAAAYCEELRTPVGEISQTVFTGDKAVDYLISSKMEQARQKRIRTKINIEFPHNTNIRSVDLATILGNLLDNALEAGERAPEHLRFLTLTIRRINVMLIIKVENGYGEAPTREKGEILTTKADKTFHGWGLKSVQTAAEHYDGTIHTEYADGVFRSVVTLSFEPVKTK